MILYIEDYFSCIQVFLVKRKLIKSNVIVIYRNPNVDKILNELNLDKHETNGIDLYYFIKEIKNFNICRLFLCKKYSNNRNLFIKVVPPEKEPLDYYGNYMAMQKVWEKVEIDNMMSWLSTLGGGFSALGDNFSNCAKTAGKISLKQLSLGIKIGDPFLQARCKLWFSISLIQIGKLKLASEIIRRQYNFAKSQKDLDNRLIKMCLGIWQKLQYEYLKRKKNKLKNVLV